MKIRLDNNWDTSPWAEEFMKAVKVEVDRSFNGIEVKFDLDRGFEAAVKKIAEEAIVRFLDPEDAFAVRACKDGVVIQGNGLDSAIVIPWENVPLDVDDENDDPRPATKAIKEWLANETAYYLDEA